MKTLNELMNEYGANTYAIEDRGGGAANSLDVLLPYDEGAKEAYGEIEMTFDGWYLWISAWQNPNTNGEYDYRVIFSI